MFQKGSFSIPSDSSGILLVKVIQTRRCSTRKHADIGKFLKVVLKNTKTKLSKRRKRKVRAIVIRSQRYYSKKIGIHYQFANNSLVLLKKRMNTIGKELYGPTSKVLKIRKFRVAFRYLYKVKLFIHSFNKLLLRPVFRFFTNLFFLKYALSFCFNAPFAPFFFLNIRRLKIKFLQNLHKGVYTKYLSVILFGTLGFSVCVAIL